MPAKITSKIIMLRLLLLDERTKERINLWVCVQVIFLKLYDDDMEQSDQELND